MLAILTDKSNWTNEVLLGQLGEKVVLEVDVAPSYEYEDISNSNLKFTQRVFGGKYGELITYVKLCEIRSLLSEVGDADSFEGLLKNKIDIQNQELLDTEVALVESFEKNLELEAAQTDIELAIIELYEMEGV